MEVLRYSICVKPSVIALIVLFHSSALSIPNYGFRFGDVNQKRSATGGFASLPLEEYIDVDSVQNYKTVEDYYGQPVSVCIDGYEGFPPNCTLKKDRPLCQYSTSCLDHEACIRGICDDPCKGIKCGDSANCVIQKHGPKCVCKREYVGNPFDRCYPASTDKQTKCQSEGDACGPEKTCQTKNGELQCLCDQSSSNSTPDCKLKPTIPNSYCFVPDDCPNHQMCINEKCRNPCENFVCGTNAKCSVHNHEPICGCNKGFKGDPHLWCESTTLENNCSPNPCNETVSICEMPNDDWPICTCKEPELCKGLAKFKQCREDFECPTLSACIDGYCRNPCLRNVCKENEFCHVHQQRPHCADYRLLNLRKWKH